MSWRLCGCLILFLISFSATAREDAKPSIAEIDRVRLSEAFRLAHALDSKIWKNWREAPFAVLLVTAEHEFLIRHPSPGSDFVAMGKDPLLDSNVFYRKRTQGLNLEATFPVAGLVPTVVIGQAENTTSKTSTPWVLTVLHEHFHQLQMSQPNYFKDVESLELSGGDETGMWMLNFPFPYGAQPVKTEFHRLAALLHATLFDKPGGAKAYFPERLKLKTLLREKDYRYLSFQLWQEGIARYTEYRVAEWCAKEYKPSGSFERLADYESFQSVAQKILTEDVIKPLQKFDLERNRRESFYPFGAAEGLLLDEINPDWRDQYWTEKFYLENYANS